MTATEPIDASSVEDLFEGQQNVFGPQLWSGQYVDIHNNYIMDIKR